MIFFQKVKNKQRMILSTPTWMEFPISFFWYITAFLRQLIHYLINSCQRTNIFQLQRYFMQNCSNSGSSICTTRCFVIPVWMTSIFNYIITWQSSSLLYQSFFHIQQIIKALNSTRLKVTMHGQFHWNQRIHIKCIVAALWQLYVTTLTRIT